MKTFKGTVKRTKMEKTATVEVVRLVAHPVYLKRYKRTKRYQVHDELGVEVGQEVKFAPCKPYSKSKRWKIIEIVGVDSKKKKVEVIKKTKKKTKS